MFAFLLLVVMSFFSLPVEAGSTYEYENRCNETMVRKIYDYWQKRGGVPQHIIQNDIRCHPREIIILAARGLVDENVTCITIDNFPTSRTLYISHGNNDISYSHQVVIKEENGELIESVNKMVRFEVAEHSCARLTYVCSRHSKAKVGPCQFTIKVDEGKGSKEGIRAMQDLLANTLDVHEPLLTFPETCPVPDEKPHPVEHCDKSSCTRHH